LQDRGPAFPTGAARPSERAGGCGNQGGTGSKHLPGRDAAAVLRLANAVHWRRVEQLIVAASVDLVDAGRSGRMGGPPRRRVGHGGDSLPSRNLGYVTRDVRAWLRLDFPDYLAALLPGPGAKLFPATGGRAGFIAVLGNGSRVARRPMGF